MVALQKYLVGIIDSTRFSPVLWCYPLECDWFICPLFENHLPGVSLTEVGVSCHAYDPHMTQIDNVS